MSNCRLCNRTRLVLRHRIGPVTVQSCADCGFVQVAEQPGPEDLRELYAPDYFDHGKYSDAFALRREHARRLALMRRAGLAPGARVLDAGCATGDFIAAAGGTYEMWGLDISEYAVARAREANPSAAERIRSGRVEEQDYPDGFFDAVVMWDVLEHLWDPVASCRRLVAVLRPGGLLLISTPNIGAWTARLMGRHWAFMTVPEHLSFFDRRTIGILLEERLGLKLEIWRSLGKWANLGFLMYKLRRVFPGAVPQALVDLFRGPGLRRLALYVPTGDIQYAAARRPGEKSTA